MNENWLDTGSHSWCPACGSGEVKVRRVFLVNGKPFSLAGVQAKVTGTWGWVYRCFTCGDEGPCGIRESTSQFYSEEAT